MSIIFDGAAMARSLEAFSRANAPFFIGGPSGLDSLARKLEIGIKAGPTSFNWGTKNQGGHVPFDSKISRVWKGNGSPTYDPVFIRFALDWTCEKTEDKGSIVRVKDGVTAISFFKQHDDATSLLKLVHFDICEGGYDGGSGHPPFHTQFHGSMNDIPRIPTFLVHPLDALEWALMDCFQDQWRCHLATSAAKTRLRGHGSLQYLRIRRLIESWTQRMELRQNEPLLALQTRLAKPIAI